MTVTCWQTCSWHITIYFPISVNPGSAAWKHWLVWPHLPLTLNLPSEGSRALASSVLLRVNGSALVTVIDWDPSAVTCEPPVNYSGSFYVHKLAACWFSSGFCGQSRDNILPCKFMVWHFGEMLNTLFQIDGKSDKNVCWLNIRLQPADS